MAQPGSPAPGWCGTIYTSGADAAARNSEQRENVKGTANLEITYLAGLLILVGSVGFLVMLLLGPIGNTALERRIVSVGGACSAILMLGLLLLALAAGISRLHHL